MFSFAKRIHRKRPGNLIMMSSTSYVQRCMIVGMNKQMVQDCRYEQTNGPRMEQTFKEAVFSNSLSIGTVPSHWETAPKSARSLGNEFSSDVRENIGGLSQSN